MTQKRPRPWAETRPQGTRFVWRFEGQRYRTPFFNDQEAARADAKAQITEQLRGTWRDPSGSKIKLEEWIDIWTGMLDDIEPTTRAKYKYLVEFHILPQFQDRQIGSLTFEEIEAWQRAIPTRTSARGRPYARSVADGARSLLITILGDAVHAGRLERNAAERQRPLRTGPGQGPRAAPGHAAAEVERDHPAPGALPGRALRGLAPANPQGRHLHLRRGLAAPRTRRRGPQGAAKDGSYRVLDLPPFLADLMEWAMDNRLARCHCPLVDGRPSCKGEDRTAPNYLFLGVKGGHPRRSNYADRFLTPAAEGLYPAPTASAAASMSPPSHGPE